MGSPPNVKEMLAVVREWIASNYPGCTLDYIEIHTLFMGREMRPITLHESPAPPMPSTQEAAHSLRSPQPAPPPRQPAPARPAPAPDDTVADDEVDLGASELRLEDFDLKPGVEEDIVAVLIAAEKPLRAERIAVRAQNTKITDHFRKSIYSLVKRGIVQRLPDNRYWLNVRAVPSSN